MVGRTQDLTQLSSERPARTNQKRDWILDVVLVLVMLLGVYFRFTGVNWDDNTHLHPDERFLTMVETALSPVNSVSEYFNTSTSSLNPANRGYTFFVYGTLPIFIVRYIGQAVGQTGYDQINLIGRQLSALADLLTIFLVYLICLRLYNRRVGLLAAAFASLSVLPIQLSHFFTVDTFTNFFGFLAIYFAVRIMTSYTKSQRIHNSQSGDELTFETSDNRDLTIAESKKEKDVIWGLVRHWGLYALFGAALGMATASKINAIALAFVLPLVEVIRIAKLATGERRKQIAPAVSNLAVAAVVCLLFFRICQPYAFSGPGFFGLKLNPNFLATMGEISNQLTGNVDFPPALQWARRPITFSLTNMVNWGLGLPLGFLACAGFLFMGWRIIRGEWKQHLMLWSWTGLYFAWQSLGFVSSMRYQMLVYPSLAIIAAWAVFALWNKGNEEGCILPRLRAVFFRRAGFWHLLASIVGGVALIGSLAWAFAFTRIYARPLTRVAASEWIYQNIPGPINLKIDTATGVFSQPIAYHSGGIVQPGQPYTLPVIVQEDGAITQVTFPFIVDTNVLSLSSDKALVVSLVSTVSPDHILASNTLVGGFPSGSDPRGSPYTFTFASPLLIKTGENYLLRIEETTGQGWIQLMGPVELTVTNSDGQVTQSLPAPVQIIRNGQPFSSVFAAFTDGSLGEVAFPHLVDQSGPSSPETLALTISPINQSGSSQVVHGTLTGFFSPGADGHGTAYLIKLDNPLAVKKQNLYQITLEMTSGNGSMAVYGSAPAIESSWDDFLPQPVEGYSPYNYYSGLYQGDLNFEMYFDDNSDKIARFENTLDQADTIFISSNRQWATTVRVPERYPLTTSYYRNLLGCPTDKDIIWCYAVAQPGMFTGSLGYKLIAVFQSNPNIGSIQFNDQFAEEAFTVYDHPKVLIFVKETNYSSQAVRKVLGSVDLSHVIHVTPREAGNLPPPAKTLMLPLTQLAQQQAGGTWSDLFNWDAIVNKYQVGGVIVWYLTVALLGLIVYPLVRLAFPGLSDRGYPLARTTGLLLLSFVVWIAGSEGIPFTRLTISIALLILASIGGFLAFRQRKELLAEWRKQSKYFLMVEGLALAFFTLDLLIRLGNPDLWHAYKGGEKPMDFSYLQAVIKSTTFPPYDPWFGGGYINYYYYGFVFVGVLVKWLGIVPSIAYNLILPTLFAMVALAAFSFGWNVSHRRPRENLDGPDPGQAQMNHAEEDASIQIVKEQKTEPDANETIIPVQPANAIFGHQFRVGLAASIGLLIIGNLGTVRMIWQGLQRLVAPGGDISNANFFTHWIWTFQGFFIFLSGRPLSFYQGDWYWVPSRVYPGEPITEFPIFTFLYADLHAHLIALGITILALVWALSILLGQAHWGEEGKKTSFLSLGLSILFGALIIGSLRPTNTWDYPTYLAIGMVAVAYTLWRYYKPGRRLGLPPQDQRILVALAGAGALAGLSLLLFQPYSQWYGQAYDMIAAWNGARSPFWSYLTHWGVFLFIISTWMAWETYDWMKNTPMVSLIKLRPYQGLIIGLLAIWVVLLAILTIYYKVEIAWLVFLLAAWATLLILRPGQPDAKRAVFFLTGTALVLTLFVEMFVLVGDIGRMNTVFKFYFQAWTLFALSAAAGFGWLLQAVPVWKPSWRFSWQTAIAVLVAGAALFPLAGGIDKILDRIATNVPITLDGMAYMPYATYDDPVGAVFQLGDDYPAILWMQQNVKGSPVIVEGNTPEYRWGSRFTIYTGLPGVVGWNFHQRQQRAILPSTVVTDRIADIATFYTTTDEQTTLNFLQKYGVQFIIVGQLERTYYPGLGLAKFSQWNGRLWQVVESTGETTIYKVNP